MEAKTLTKDIEKKRIHPLEHHVIDILQRLSDLHDDHHEHKAVVTTMHENKGLKEEMERFTSFVHMSTDTVFLRQEETRGLVKMLTNTVADMETDLGSIRNWIMESTGLHFEGVGEDIVQAVQLRDDLRNRCFNLSKLLLDVTNKQKQKGRPSSSTSELRQLGAIASSLRSVVIPTLAQFRTISDRAAKGAKFSTTMKRQGGNKGRSRRRVSERGYERGLEEIEKLRELKDEDQEQRRLHAVQQAVASLTISREEVDASVCDLSAAVAEAWTVCSQRYAPTQPQTVPRPPTPGAQPLSPSRKRKTKKKIGLGINEVQLIVNHALEDLQKALREKASKVMVGVVQEASLAQIDVLRDELGRIDAISRRSDLLQEALDDHVRDLSKVYDHLMSVARNGGETNDVVAELRARIDETTEEVANIASDKARVEAMQYKLMAKTVDATREAKSTDQRLSHIMGTFMSKVEGSMNDVKRESGEAAHELKKRFTQELRGSMQRVSSKLSSLEGDIRMIHPLVNTDVARLGTTSLVLASRCMSCDRPTWGTNRTNNHSRGGIPGTGVSANTYLPNTLSSMNGSLLLAQTAPTARNSESRGGGFRVATLSPGAGMLWVGGQGSPTGRTTGSGSGSGRRRPRSSMSLKRY